MESKTLKQIELERSILMDLQVNGDSTIQEMADALNVNYYTARQCLSNLFAAQKVKVVGQNGRQRIYGLSDSERIRDTIPYISNVITRTQHKVVALLASVGHEDDIAAVGAVKEMPELIVRLLSLANDASHDLNVNDRIENLRDRMQRNFLTLKNATLVYEQVLQDPRFWTPKYLKEFVDDPDYHYPDIMKAVEYYD